MEMCTFCSLAISVVGYFMLQACVTWGMVEQEQVDLALRVHLETTNPPYRSSAVLPVVEQESAPHLSLHHPRHVSTIIHHHHPALSYTSIHQDCAPLSPSTIIHPHPAPPELTIYVVRKLKAAFLHVTCE